MLFDITISIVNNYDNYNVSYKNNININGSRRKNPSDSRIRKSGEVLQTTITSHFPCTLQYISFIKFMNITDCLMNTIFPYNLYALMNENLQHCSIHIFTYQHSIKNVGITLFSIVLRSYKQTVCLIKQLNIMVLVHIALLYNVFPWEFAYLSLFFKGLTFLFSLFSGIPQKQPRSINVCDSVAKILRIQTTAQGYSRAPP